MRHVMIVGEVRSLRILLRRILEQEGYAVVEAPDGGAARELLRGSREPMVVLLNTGAAGDGIGLMRAAAAEPDIGRHAFVLLTANAEGLAPLWRQLVGELAVPVVAKPFDLDVLLHAVDRAEAHIWATDPPATSARGHRPARTGTRG